MGFNSGFKGLITLVVQSCRDKAGFDLPPVGVSASSE